MTRNCDHECTCPCHLGNPRIKCECYVERPVRALRPAPPARQPQPTIRHSRKAHNVPDKRRDGSNLLETAIENYLDRQVRLKGGRTFKIAAVFEKGVPDRLVLSPWGRQYLVEMKKADGVLSPTQVEKHRQIKRMGHVVHVLASKAEVDAFVKWIVNTGPGLRNAKRQHALDLEAVTNGYFVSDIDTADDLAALL